MHALRTTRQGPQSIDVQVICIWKTPATVIYHVKEMQATLTGLMLPLSLCVVRQQMER